MYIREAAFLLVADKFSHTNGATSDKRSSTLHNKDPSDGIDDVSHGHYDVNTGPS